MSAKTRIGSFLAVFLCVFFSACVADSSKEIEAAFVSLLTAIHEDDREVVLRVAPFFSELSEEEEKSMRDLFKEIASSVKKIEAVPGGRRTKNLTVTLPETGLVFTFGFEQKNSAWILTKNIRLKKIAPKGGKND
jgi:hypothetical protein